MASAAAYLYQFMFSNVSSGYSASLLKVIELHTQLTAIFQVTVPWLADSYIKVSQVKLILFFICMSASELVSSSIFGVFLVCFDLSVPVQVIAWKYSASI